MAMDEELENWIKYGNAYRPGEKPNDIAPWWVGMIALLIAFLIAFLL